MELPKAIKPTFSLVRNFAQKLKIKMKREYSVRDSFFGGKILKFCLPHFTSWEGGIFGTRFFMFWIGSRNFSPFNVKYFLVCPHMMMGH